MIPAWIIDKIREWEAERDQPVVQVPEPPLYREPDPEVSPAPAERGVVIVDL